MDSCEKLPMLLECHNFNFIASKEILYSIFRFLTLKELCCAARVCRSWYDTANDNRIWKSFINLLQEDAFEKANEMNSFKQFFMTYPEYRKHEYLLNDQCGRKLYKQYQSIALEHFETIKQMKKWSELEQEEYQNDFEAAHKGHRWITQILDIICSVSYFEAFGSRVANNGPGGYVEAFNYLYEKNALDKKTITCIKECVDDKNLSKQFSVHYYAYFIVLFYRVGMLNDENLIAIKTSFNPDNYCAEALEILLNVFKCERDVQKKQQEFVIYRDALFKREKTYEPGDMALYAECMVRLYNNKIFLSYPSHAVIYNGILQKDSTEASFYLDAYLILHKEKMLIGKANRIFRYSVLKCTFDEARLCAKEIVRYHQSALFNACEFDVLERLTIDTELCSEQLETLPSDIEDTDTDTDSDCFCYDYLSDVSDYVFS